MTITLKPRQYSLNEFVVYYNELTGEIISVGKTVRDIEDPYILTLDKIADRILQGTAYEYNYLVSENADGDKVIMTKIDTLQLQERRDNLFTIPRKKLKDWDMRVKFYTKNLKLVIEANSTILDRISLFQTLEFYMTKHNMPDYLISSFDIDIKELVKTNIVVFDMQYITKYVNVDDIDILVRQDFKNYYFEILYEGFGKLEDDLVFNKSLQMVKSNVKNSHIELNQIGNQLVVSSTMSIKQFIDIGIPSKILDFYVVGSTPDEFIRHIEIDMSKLQKGKVSQVAIDFDINDVSIMYQNSKLKVSKSKAVFWSPKYGLYLAEYKVMKV